jgi:hydrogenase-4 component F
MIGIGSVEATLIVPAFAIPILALVSAPRLGATLNILACAMTLSAAVAMVFTERPRSDLIVIDDFNIFMIILTTFVGFTTSIFSATYLAHEMEIGRLTPVLLRFYHAMYQALMCAMNVVLVANNIGLMWVGVEVATLLAVIMVGMYRRPEAIEAAWKYFIVGSVGSGLAFFGTILVYLVAQDVVGEGLPAMSWDLLAKSAPMLDPKLLSLAFVFLLVGYSTKVGLAPFHAWLPDAHAGGPTAISAVQSGLLLNIALYVLLRFKMVLAGNEAAIDVGSIMVGLGLVSLVFAAFMLYRLRDIKRLFAYSSIEHMGIAAFAFGMGGPLANFAGLLHITMHAFMKSGIFFAVGHIVQVKGTQHIAAISGISVTHPVLAVLFTFGVIAIAGLPPFGMFTSEFMLISSTFAQQPVLGVVLVAGLLIAFGALILRLQDIVFGEPTGEAYPAQASYFPVYVHLTLVLIAGLWLPDPIVRWFRGVAASLG